MSSLCCLHLCVCLLGMPPAAASSSAPTAGYATFFGQWVSAVEVEAPSAIDRQEMRALIDIQPGFLLDPADVQAAIMRLYALGRLAQVEVWAEPTAQGSAASVTLRFGLTPLRRLRTIAIHSDQAVGEDGLRQALRLRGGDEVDRRTIGMLQGRAAAYLQRKGYGRAQVQVQRLDDAGGVWSRFVLRIVSAAPRRLQRLHFSGHTRLPQALLRELVTSRPGDPLDLDTLHQDAEALRQSFNEHGFLRARVAPARLLEVPAPSRGSPAYAWCEATFDIEAGPRISIDFVGNTLLRGSALKALIPQDEALPLGAALRLLPQKIARAYERLGYPDASVRVHQVHAGPQRLQLVVHIDEGRPLQVAQLRFLGNTALPSKLLHAQVQALMRRELTPQDVAQPLGTYAQRCRSGAYAPLPPAPARPVPLRHRYVKSLYNEAAAQIAAVYRDMGYLDVQVQAPQLHKQKFVSGPGGAQSAHVTVSIEEGTQTFLAHIALAGNHAFGAAELLQRIADSTANRPLSVAVAPGAPLSVAGIEDARIDLIRHYRNAGYLYARVESDISVDPDRRWGQLRYAIDEGPQLRIAHVLLRGNAHTRDGIVRSRMRLRAGDVYSLDKALADQRSISALGVFNSVRVKLVDEEHHNVRTDVVTEVVERARQPVEVAPGISTANGPRLRTTYSHLNVLGTAATFTASLRLNRPIFFGLFGNFADDLRRRYATYHGWQQLTRATERESRLGLRSPPIAALPFDPVLRVDLVDQRVNAVRYALDREAFILGADLSLPLRFRGSAEAQIGIINLECDAKIDPNCNLNPEVRRLQSRPIDIGRLWIFKTGPYLVWDRRDNALNPSAGLLGSLRATYAFGQATALAQNRQGAFAPFAFAKYEGALTGYIPLWGPVLALSARAGSISLLNSQVPIEERFFLGGRDTVRGFVESTLIPQDACIGPGPQPPGCAEQILRTDAGPPLSRGGNAYVLFKTELRLPISETLSLGLFVDLGNLWVRPAAIEQLALRLGTGTGIRYATPVGALAIDLGINPAPRRQQGEPYTQLHFSIGAF